MRFPKAAALLVCALAALSALSTASCDAELTPGCIDGTCTGATGAGGGACDIPDTHGFPCGVYQILSNICQQCHVPGGQGPFPLQEYCDTQAEYGKKPIWVRMERAIKPGAVPSMPFMQDPLSEADMATMNAWFDTCGRDGTHGDDPAMGGATSYDFGLCAGPDNGPPPACGEGGAGGAGGAPAGGSGGTGG